MIKFNTVNKYKKKPIEIEAIKWDGENDIDVVRFLGGSSKIIKDIKDSEINYYIPIETLEGVMRASLGDFIIKGINGEFYPCKPDIFLKTYNKTIDESRDKLLNILNELKRNKNKPDMHSFTAEAKDCDMLFVDAILEDKIKISLNTHLVGVYNIEDATDKLFQLGIKLDTIEI